MRKLGEDVTKLVAIELKAYRKIECISKKEITQIKRNVKKYGCDYGIIITTTDKVPKEKNWLKIWDYHKLIELVRNNGMIDEIKNISWIRNKIININREEIIQKKRGEIITFVRNRTNDGIFPKKRELESHFNIDLRTYFGKKPMQKIHLYKSNSSSNIPCS